MPDLVTPFKTPLLPSYSRAAWDSALLPHGHRAASAFGLSRMIHPRRSSLIAVVKAHFLRGHHLAGFRVLSAVCRSGRRMLASDGGSAEVVHALVAA